MLIKKVNKLSEIVGIEEYPASLPASLISKDEGFLGNLIPNPDKKIANLTQLIGWYVERFDEIMGQWEIPIEVKDSDPTKPGDQPQGFKLPNIAEAIAELFTLTLQTNINSEVLLNAQVRDLVEGAADKQQNFITYKLIQALTDYLGYKTKDISADMPLTITLNKTRYDEILKESVVKVPVQELDEKFGLEIDLMKFRKAASILDSVYFRKLNPNGDIKQQILDYLLKTHRDVNKVAENKDDLDQFLQQVEEGFVSIPGMNDPTHPYGRDYSERPRIRDLSKYNPEGEQ